MPNKRRKRITAGELMEQLAHDAEYQARIAERDRKTQALTVRDGGDLVSAALLQEFHLEKSPELKWVLANALITAMPYHRRRKIPAIGEVRYGKKRSGKPPQRMRSKHPGSDR